MMTTEVYIKFRLKIPSLSWENCEEKYRATFFRTRYTCCIIDRS